MIFTVAKNSLLYIRVTKLKKKSIKKEKKLLKSTNI